MLDIASLAMKVEFKQFLLGSVGEAGTSCAMASMTNICRLESIALAIQMMA